MCTTECEREANPDHDMEIIIVIIVIIAELSPFILVLKTKMKNLLQPETYIYINIYSAISSKDFLILAH